MLYEKRTVRQGAFGGFPHLPIPIRYRLLELLVEQPRHINALSNALDMERRLVSYHLTTLEEHGFVTSKYVISEQEKT
jgi:DNA-binding transcriptional ArsR family regulator